MSNYTKSTNFATKDNLTPGDPLKIVRGTEIDTEFNNIATAIATKTDNASAAITGGTINDTTIGATTASTGAFTTISATGAITSTLATGTAPLVVASTTKVTNLNVDSLDGADWASPAALGSTTPAAVSATTLSASGNVTLSGGTANGVAYLNGSKVVTSGSALQFDGTNFGIGGTGQLRFATSGGAIGDNWIQTTNSFDLTLFCGRGSTTQYNLSLDYHRWAIAGSEVGRFTSTGLGIGTSSPSQKLDVAGIITATAWIGRANGSAPSADCAIYRAADNTLGFSTASTERMRLDSSGNLGLGVTPSAWNSVFKAVSVGRAGSNLFGQTSSNLTGVTANAIFDSSDWKYVTSDNASRYQQNSGVHSWFTAPSGTAGNAITFTQAMTLDASGRLGIGETSPSSRLVVGSVSDASNFFRINSSTVQTVFGSDASGGYVGTDNSYALRFFTNNTERARIDSSGNLLVGTTTAGGRLAVTAGSAAQSPIATTSVTGDTAYQAILVTKFDNDSTTSQNFIQFQINNGSANCGKITANGANTAAFGSTSDQRVKENIAELPSQLANIMALRPVEFDYIESYGGGHQVGFIAQEIQQVYPDVISTDDSSEKIMSITGWSKTEARLVKAIQEQQAIIESLKARLDAANL